MKIGGIDVVDFIEQVPVLRLFAKNLALSGGLAFIIQDFLIPLYAELYFLYCNCITCFCNNLS